MGYVEIAFILVLSFIIIGPKDFPKVMYRLGSFIARLKALSAHFYEHWDIMAENEDIKSLPSTESGSSKKRRKKTRE